ncbi:MAG: cation diffusion facilitator family transporter [Maricaulaceae bacterium]
MTDDALISNDRTDDTDQPKMRGRPGRLAPEDSARITRRITVIAVLLGLLLAVGKAFVWKVSGSVGILSSLVHSSLDMFAALSTYFAVRYAARTPDKNYRFGRGKAESFSAVFQVCLIVFAAVHLAEEAYARILNPESLSQGGFAIASMLLFSAVTLWLLFAQSWAIRATGSIAVRGDRAHYFADLLGNVFVIIGIVLSSYTSLARADAVIGLLLSLWLLYTAYRVASLAWAQLMDKELPDEERDFIKDLALQDPHVQGVFDLRTRASGPHIHIQMRLNMDEGLSLSEAHDIVLAAEKRMMSAYQGADILIHPHPSGCQHAHGNLRFREES